MTDLNNVFTLLRLAAPYRIQMATKDWQRFKQIVRLSSEVPQRPQTVTG